VTVDDVVAVGIDVTHGPEQERVHRALAGIDVHHAVGSFDDVPDPGQILAGLLDVPDVLEIAGEAGNQGCGHVHIGGDRVVVQHDRHADRLRDGPVIAPDLIVGGRVVIRRQHHQAIGAQFLGLLAVANGIGRMGVHGPDDDVGPAGYLPDSG